VALLAAFVAEVATAVTLAAALDADVEASEALVVAIVALAAAEVALAAAAVALACAALAALTAVMELLEVSAVASPLPPGPLNIAIKLVLKYRFYSYSFFFY
jgi:hypothetical protein